MTKGRFRDLTGKRFGRLLVVERASNRNRHVYWACRCDCGNEIEVRADALTRGPTVSCGCYQHEVVTQHGMWRTPTYHVWRSMLNRCENPNMHAYHLYGGRGIKVCEAWHDFERFYADMGHKPKGRSLDRIDNDGEYEPDNCRWATAKQQCRNRNDNVQITFRGETRCLAGWAEKMGIKNSTLSQRFRRGWSVREALTTPVDLGNRWKRHASA